VRPEGHYTRAIWSAMKTLRKTELTKMRAEADLNKYVPDRQGRKSTRSLRRAGGEPCRTCDAIIKGEDRRGGGARAPL